MKKEGRKEKGTDMFTSAASILKLEPYREDYHGPMQGWHANLWSVVYF